MLTTGMGLTTSCIVIHRFSDNHRQRFLTVGSYTATATSKGTPRLRVGLRIIFLSGGARHPQPVVEGLSATSQHANGGGMCQLRQPWLRLLVFSPHPPPPVLLGVLRSQSTDASVHCQRLGMTIALLVLVVEWYSHSQRP
jgi:hypothetical protein